MSAEHAAELGDGGACLGEVTHEAGGARVRRAERLNRAKKEIGEAS
ncbi:hypothetical protein [Polyangium mundeleinium]|uniref:Uncharacterized protein n=1 Tax=Polyangium mundeleinium TaxID=2995306 RepID=A0ABT5F4F2_9BACT|nr:hypothetical protein [Polyangium mundeleinium]MDC0747955.1 hypothetical protein [Polyangium mundeleinium]